MRARLLIGAIAAAVLVGVSVPVVYSAVAGASPGETQPTYTWPEFHQNASLTGVSADPSISTANASKLGVQWMSSMRGPSFSSPIVAWSGSLKKTLVYTANETGYVTAFDEATGEVVWSKAFGVPIRSTMMVDGSDLWMGTDQDSHLYKMNASTGAVECSVRMPLPIEASPVHGTPPGGVDTVYIATNDGGLENGTLFAVTESDCAVQWKTTAWGATPSNCHGCAGLWDPIGFGIGANGRAVLTFGTADPDTSLYAVDALTGARLWRDKAPIIPPNDGDCGAGVTISPPGVHGFADGVAYGECKDGIMFAINLETGAVIWESNFRGVDGSNPGARSTPALSGNTLVSGDLLSCFALNATTGQELWYYPTGGYEVLGSPVIVGPVGEQVVAFDDVAGVFRVVSLATGKLLYQYELGNYTVSSIAETDGNLVTTDSDGYVYDFAIGGGNGPAPTTAVTSPANGSTVANPDGSLTISGTATAASGSTSGIDAVHVAIQRDGSKGPWWNAATQSWEAGIDQMAATLNAPGDKTTQWSVTLPVPAAGANLQVFASAVSGKVADISAQEPQTTTARSSFSVAAAPAVPVLNVSSAWVTPGQSYTISGSGWQPNETVKLTIGDETVRNPVTADSSGNLEPTTVIIPGATAFGPSSIVATGTKSPPTSVAVYVSNEWTQWRSEPNKAGTEINDEIIGKNVAYNHVNYLQQAWLYQSGASAESSPAVFEDVAYFGNQQGVIAAVNVQTAIPVWTYQAAGYVDSSPAVDDGLVIVGTGADSVIALNESTGALVWTATVGGAVESSPAVYDGVVYIGADDNKVYALDESTGAVIWSTTLSGEVQSSPALDPAAGLLAIGDNSGAVTAMSMSTGSVKWSYTTGAEVTATPAIAAGQVVAASQDGSVYSLDEGTGKVTWSYATGGPITASPVIDANQGYVVVGSQSGVFAELQGTSGAAVVSRNVGTPFVGVSEGSGPQSALIVATTSSGVVWGIKPQQVGDISWEWDGPMDIASSATIVNSAVYITGEDGSLRAFTIPGKPIY